MESNTTLLFTYLPTKQHCRKKADILLEIAQAIMLQSYLPTKLWEDAILTACYLINRMLSSSIENKTLIWLLFPQKPLFSLKSKVFGCIYFVHMIGPHKGELVVQSIKFIFIGYPRNQKGYNDMISYFKRSMSVWMLLSLSVFFIFLNHITQYVLKCHLSNIFLLLLFLLSLFLFQLFMNKVIDNTIPLKHTQDAIYLGRTSSSIWFPWNNRCWY